MSSSIFITACSAANSGQIETRGIVSKKTEQENIVGRWKFEDPGYGFLGLEWMEFFEDGTYLDNGNNSGSYVLLSDNQLKITSSIGGIVWLYNIKLQGDSIELTDDEGYQVSGTRLH